MDPRVYYYLVILTARKFKAEHPYCRSKFIIRDYYHSAKEEIETEWGFKIAPMGKKAYSKFVHEVTLAIKEGVYI